MYSPRRQIGAALVTSAASLVLSVGVLAAPAGAQTSGPAASPNVVTPPVITTTAGTGSAGFSGDGGAATSAKVNAPSGVAEDLAGNIYFGDTANNRVRKVTAGIITTVAGSGSYGFGGDGGQAKLAKLAGPTGVAVDASGNLYIADSNNGRIRKVTPAGIITTVAGNGSGFFGCGSGGNGGLATRAGLCAPTSVATDSGNLYIADVGNNQIRKVTAAGIISAAAGNGSYGNSGDGVLATSARLANPTAVTFDSLHNMYIADTGNNRVREVTTAGIISNFAGGGKNAGGQNGEGGKCIAAQLNSPSGLGTDALGYVYIADTFDHRIRVCIPKGDILTYAGTGVRGYSGDGGPATAAKLSYPSGNIAVDPNNIFFGDTGNNRLRRVQGGPPPNIPEIPFSIALLPLSAAVLLGGGYVIARRRRTSALVAAH